MSAAIAPAPTTAPSRPAERFAGWLARYSITLLRISLGLVFFGFGVLKFFPGISPVEELVSKTFHILTFGLIDGRAAMIITAIPECLIGLSLLSGRFLKAGLALLGVCLLGIMSPLVLLTSELFPEGAPTLTAQYVLKDVVLAAAALVVAATAFGAQLIVTQREVTTND
jgi:uncharacterized membrane protein YkgB